MAEGLLQTCCCGNMTPKHNIFGLHSISTYNQYLSRPQYFFIIIFIQFYSQSACIFSSVDVLQTTLSVFLCTEKQKTLSCQ